MKKREIQFEEDKKVVLRIANKIHLGINNGYKKDNYCNRDIVNAYGMDVYRTLYSVYLYWEYRTIKPQVMAWIIDKEKANILKAVCDWYNNILYKMNWNGEIKEEISLEINSLVLYVWMVEELGLAGTYDVIERFFRIDYSSLVDISEKRIGCESNNIKGPNKITKDIFDAFSINENYVSLDQIKTMVNTKFTVGESRGNRSSVLNIVGVNLFDLLADITIISRMKINTLEELDYQKGELLNIYGLYHCFPSDLYGIYKPGRNDRCALGQEEQNVLLALNSLFIMKSLVALLFVNYLDYRDEEIFFKCKRLFKKNTCVSSSKRRFYRNPDMMLLSYFAEVNNVKIKAKKTVDKPKSEACSWNVSVEWGLSGEERKIDFCVYETEKKVYSAIISKICEQWSGEWLLKSEIKKHVHIKSNTCKANSSNLQNEEQKKPESNDKPKPVLSILKSNSRGNSVQRPKKTYDFTSKDNTLFLVRSAWCVKHKHNVVSVTGTLITLRRKTININVNYCRDCKRFFINIEDFKKYAKIHGPMQGNYSFKYMEYDRNENIYLADESPLYTCGYNVNQQVGYTDMERRKILANIIDYGIMKKPEIIEYLHFFINNNGKKRNMKKAVSKWRDDLDYVNMYKIDKQKKYKISKVM